MSLFNPRLSKMGNILVFSFIVQRAGSPLIKIIHKNTPARFTSWTNSNIHIKYHTNEIKNRTNPWIRSRF